MLKKAMPFAISLGGVVSDYVTTTIGLSLGFVETHITYSPIWALTIFWVAVSVLSLSLPRKKIWYLAINGLASASYLGFVNNTLVILGVFSGLRI